jgi:hypothetical protein
MEASVDFIRGESPMFLYHSKDHVYVVFDPPSIGQYDKDNLDLLETIRLGDESIASLTGFYNYLFIACGSKVHQWDLQQRGVVRTFEAKGDIYTLSIVDGMLYAGGSGDTTAGLVTSWDIRNGRQTWTYDYDSRVTSVLANTNVSYVLCEDKNFYVTNLSRLETEKIPIGACQQSTFMSKSIGDLIYMSSYDCVATYDTRRGETEVYQFTKSSAVLTSDNKFVLYTQDYGTSSIITAAPTNDLSDAINYIYQAENRVVDAVVLDILEYRGYIYVLTESHVIKMEFRSDQIHHDDGEEEPTTNVTIAEDAEEDSEDYTDLTTEKESIGTSRDLESCTNNNLFTLEPYVEDDDPIVVYLPNSKMHFERSVCSTKEEIVQYLESMRDTAIPDNIMTIYTSPKDRNVSGYGGKPTGRIVVKLPVMNVYVTYGSIKKILHSKNRTWYAMPLFGGKRRRVGNLLGIFGPSMNHGQVPGYLIYKLYDKAAITNRTEVNETDSDYPTFLVDNAKTLYEIVGDENINSVFVQGLVKGLVG